jgi:hypothetical protein
VSGWYTLTVTRARAYQWKASRLRSEGRSGLSPRPDKQLTSAAMCCTLQHMNKILSSPSKPPRVSVPVSAEVLTVFERLAKAGNMSTGRAMAEWLADTVEGAEFMASTMERARIAPKLVTAELHAMMLGVTDETKVLMDKFSKMGIAARSGDASGAPPSASIPPSCNTGGKVPRVNTNKKPKGLS